MPYKSEKIKLTGMQDRRRRLTDEERQEILEIYQSGLSSLKKLADAYGVSKKTVLLIVNPESAEKAKQYRKENWQQWQRKGEEWNKVQREHRAYKQQLYLNGELAADGLEDE